MKEINIKTKMPNWLQVVLYWLMTITDGIFIGVVITKGFATFKSLVDCFVRLSVLLRNIK